MELVIAAAVLAAVLFAGRKSSSSPSSPSSTTSPGGSASGSGSQPAPAPAGPLAPGVYPAGTPGAIAVVVYVQGGDGSMLTASPGGTIGAGPSSSKTIWYGPGTRVNFRAWVDGFSPFTAFDHFEGPGGASTRSSSFDQVILQTGYVRAVFAFLGQVGR